MQNVTQIYNKQSLELMTFVNFFVSRIMYITGVTLDIRYNFALNYSKMLVLV